jgi:hypothetical protein
MAKTTGPILVIGGITLANQVIVNNKPIDWRIPIATGLAAGMFALAEKGWEDGAVALSYLALVTVIFVRVDPKIPAPAESFNKWFNRK